MATCLLDCSSCPVVAHLHNSVLHVVILVVISKLCTDKIVDFFVKYSLCCVVFTVYDVLAFLNRVLSKHSSGT